MDKVARRFAHKSVAVEFGRKKIAPINARARGGGKRRQRAVSPKGARLVAAIDARIDPAGPDMLIGRDSGADSGQPAASRAAFEILRRHEVAAQLIAVRGIKEPPEIVVREAPLRACHVRLA